MHMPLDYPRINQFPEWFTVADRDYPVHEAASPSPKTYTGKQLHEGIPIDLQPAIARYFSSTGPRSRPGPIGTQGEVNLTLGLSVLAQALSNLP